MVELVGPDRAHDAQHRQQAATPPRRERARAPATRCGPAPPPPSPPPPPRRRRARASRRPAARPRVSSSGLTGGISISTMLPWNLAIISDEVVLAKAFCTIAIMMRPGARNSRNGTPAIDALLPAHRQQEDREEQQGRHHRRRDRLHPHFQEAMHLAQVERPQADPVHRPEPTHRGRRQQRHLAIHAWTLEQNHHRDTEVAELVRCAARMTLDPPCSPCLRGEWHEIAGAETL